MRTSFIPTLLLLAVVLASCGDDSTTEAGATTTTTTTGAGEDPVDGTPGPVDESGTVRVRLEPVDGFFIEGFEVGLRFETGAGEVIEATLWSDFVTSADNPTIEDFYGSVLEQEVPAGPVVVLATANIGMGPGPVIPDVTGDLDCRLELDVTAGETFDVEVSFDDTTDCLRAV